MKLVAVVCSKNRVKELSTSALPFVKSLGVDYFIVVEPQEKEAYLKVVELDKLIVLEKSNQGLGYALKSAKEEVLKRGYDAIFKIDDDVRGLLNIDGVSIKKDLPKICQALEKFPTAAHQIKQVSQAEKRFQFGDMFTSSISNYNIAAAYHRDTGNLPASVNAIYTKRWQAKGGNLHVPEFNLCIEQSDESLLVYPAWKSIHGVTPIEPLQKGGYRNSLVFYPLNAFIPKK